MRERESERGGGERGWGGLHAVLRSYRGLDTAMPDAITDELPADRYHSVNTCLCRCLI